MRKSRTRRHHGNTKVWVTNSWLLRVFQPHSFSRGGASRDRRSSAEQLCIGAILPPGIADPLVIFYFLTFDSPLDSGNETREPSLGLGQELVGRVNFRCTRRRALLLPLFFHSDRGNRDDSVSCPITFRFLLFPSLPLSLFFYSLINSNLLIPRLNGFVLVAQRAINSREGISLLTSRCSGHDGSKNLLPVRFSKLKRLWTVTGFRPSPGYFTT